ncbi:MAG: hypothetical protein QM698_12235 [Micropepsaceae bacterium]
MKQIADLPAIFARYDEAGGVLQHYLFENAGADEATARAAIVASVPTIDAAGLANLEARRIDRQQLLGSWCRSPDGELVFPDSSAISLPDTPYDGGNYAYAFAFTPYGMKASPTDIQSMFSEIMAIILPRDEEAAILDWASPELVEVAPFFRAGAEWWGVFLFTIQLPRLRKLIVIAGSTTD